MVALTYATPLSPARLAPDRRGHLAEPSLPRPRQADPRRARHRRSSSAVCEALWAGTFESEEELRHYFDVMGPLYSLNLDPVKAQERRGRAIVSADAINEGFGGFLCTYDVTGQLQNITCPTLVIAGRHDWICPPEFSEEIARLIPQSDLRIFERSGHSVAADEPRHSSIPFVASSSTTSSPEFIVLARRALTLRSAKIRGQSACSSRANVNSRPALGKYVAYYNRAGPNHAWCSGSPIPGRLIPRNRAGTAACDTPGVGRPPALVWAHGVTAHGWTGRPGWNAAGTLSPLAGECGEAHGHRAGRVNDGANRYRRLSSACWRARRPPARWDHGATP